MEMEDIDFSDLEHKYAVGDSEAVLERFVVVDGCPMVPESKLEPLLKVLTKRFAAAGQLAKQDPIFLPMEDGKTRGVAFVEFESAEVAEEAVRTLNHKKLDAKHTFLANRLADVERYGAEGNVATEYQAPVVAPYEPKEHLRSWLADNQGRDQFFVQRDSEIDVFWHAKSFSAADTNRGGSKKVPLENATDPEAPIKSTAPARWSPKGTYLVTFQPQGIQLFGGPSWKSVGRFAHREPKAFQFSPNENFLVTVSDRPIAVPTGDPKAMANTPFKEQDEGNMLVVWDVKTQVPLRTFALLGDVKRKVWPVFKWSADDKYFARLVPDEGLAIYDSKMHLVDKKSVSIPGIVAFEFAPALIKLANSAQPEVLLAYWTPETPNSTARVSLMVVPSKAVVRSRNLFNVAGCRLQWQDEAKYLCVKVDRHTKSKKSTFTNLEFFRIAEKDIPVEVVELKDLVVNFAWEPKSDRFVIISRPDVATAVPGAVAAGMAVSAAPQTRNNVSFYALENAQGVQTVWRQTKRVERKALNSIYWSPRGRFVVVASVGAGNQSDLEFYDMDHEIPGAETGIAEIGTSEHYGMTDLHWDPSGRFVATMSSAWRHAVDNGYKIWDFKGGILREEAVERFGALLWRPRPPSILPASTLKTVRKNLKTYSRRFDEEDAMEASEASRELILRRRAVLAQWREWRSEVESTPSPAAAAVEESDLVEEVVEEVLEEVEEEL